jgi:membrane protease YdiL (CAAX protease family)
MKLEVSETQAYILTTLIASFFVLAVYVWKPFVTAPAKIRQLQKKKVN